MMKRKIISLVAVVFGTTGVFAQSSLVATLTHGKNMASYYGEGAFEEAYNAAEEGDCITLSSGTFTGSNMTIRKAITIRGAGMMNDVESEMAPTIIKPRLTVVFSDEPSTKLVIESLQLSSIYTGDVGYSGISKEYVVLNKCKIESLSVFSYNPYLTHCIVGSTSVEYVTTRYHNCIITGGGPSNSESSRQSEYVNCVYFPNYYGGLAPKTMRNCLLIGNGGVYSNGKNSLGSKDVYHCVAYSITNSDLFGNLEGNTTNWQVESLSDIFKNFSDTAKDIPTNYELTDEAKAKFLGDDGTQVGIYGGINPFTLTPTNPRITNFAITANNEGGKLRVKLNVK